MNREINYKYERLSDFLKEWGCADYHNILIETSNHGDGLHLKIAQYRFNRVVDIDINDEYSMTELTKFDFIKNWKLKSLQILTEQLLKDYP